MFDAIVHGRVDLEGLEFDVRLAGRGGAQPGTRSPAAST